MIDKLIEKYIALRDRKAEMKAAFDNSVAVIDAAMEKVENVILGKLNDSGGDSIATPAGTAFKQEMTSATVADRDTFLGHVIERQSWNLLDVRANKTAVSEFKTANGDVPPGVAWRAETVVRIRRPNAAKAAAETI
jgi:hypothetical protein